MVVVTNLHLGLGLVTGNVFSIRRIVTGVPSGVTISSAKLTVKTNLSDPIGSAIFSLSATVEDAGSSGTGTVRWDLTAANNNAVTAGTLYFFDQQYTFSDGSILTLETGQTQWTPAVTT